MSTPAITKDVKVEVKNTERLVKLGLLEISELTRLIGDLTGEASLIKTSELTPDELDRRASDQAFLKQIADPKTNTAAIEKRAALIAKEQEEQRMLRDRNISQLGRKRTMMSQYSLMYEHVKQAVYNLTGQLY